MRGFVLSAVVCAMSAFAASRAYAWCRLTTSMENPTATMPCVTAGIPLAWKRPCIEYAIDVRGSADISFSDLRDMFARSFSEWLSVKCSGVSPDFQIRQLTETSICRKAEYNRKGKNVNTIGFVNNWTELGYDSRAYAITTVWNNPSTGEILDVDMQINQGQAPYAICPDLGCPGYRTRTAIFADIENIVTHEVGHFFGLAHSPDDEDATMFASSIRGETAKRTLEQDDMNGYCAAYGSATLGSKCDFDPPGGLDLNCEDGSGGCSVEKTPPRNSAFAPILALLVALLAIRLSRSGKRS